MLTGAYRRLLGRLFPDAAPQVHRAVPGVCNKRLVLLLGFGGSKRKNFAKLIQSYNSLGYTVVSHVNPLLTPNFVSNSFEHQIGDVVHSTCKELELDNSNSKCNNKSSIIAHIYSNNGTWVYASLMKKGLIPQPTKLIWDSAPILHYAPLPLYSEASLFTRVVTSVVLGGATYHHPTISPLLKSILLPCFVIRRIFEKVPYLNDFLLYDYLSLNKYLRDTSPAIPALFIYSSGDKLVDKEYIIEFINFLKKRDFKIETLEFGEDVSHTGSFYKYKSEYVVNMIKFIDS